MLTLSETMQAAREAGNPERILLEFTDPDTSAVTTFSNEEIAVTAGVRLSTPFNLEDELTIGLCPSAEISFSLLNDERQLSDFTFGEFSAWLGYRIDSGTPSVGAKTKTYTEGGVTVTYEFAPLGVFIAERPDVVDRDVIQIRATDRMSLFDVEMPDKTTLGLNPTSSNPVTILALLQAMCTNVGVTLANTAPDWFLNHNLTFSSWPKRAFESKTMREVLKWIAEAAGSIARFNRAGNLQITWFSTVNVTYDQTGWSEFSQSWYETAAIDGLKVRNEGETAESSYGTGTNPYVIAGNPFLR